jgi:AraC family transcriptional regulator, arabinose operon regulatory protein
MAEASGSRVTDYLRKLGASDGVAVLPTGEDFQLVHLFNEVLRSLQRGIAPLQLIHASHALGHLLSLVMLRRHQHGRESADGLQRVARTIDYMDEHLHEPLRVAALAELAGLSPAHFAVLFKQQTGSSPRDYLHLLRIHRACRLLDNPSLSVKEIAALLGYQDPFHFSRTFKAFQGISPTDYRGGRRPHGA